MLPLLPIENENARFFISNTFISYTRLKLAKNQVKGKQHPEAELLLFENYMLSSSMLSSKNNLKIFQKLNVSVLMKLYH